ncbi:MAG: MFS transporter [Pseudomonadota bacterium]
MSEQGERIPPVAADQESRQSGRLRALAVVLCVGLGVAAGPLDTAVNVAFPSITAAFGVDVDAIQWVVVSYVLTYSSLLLGFGRLADLYGHRRIFVIGIVWSIVALAGCGLAREFGWFLLARFAQGVGTALLLCTGPALMTLSFAPSERTKVLAWYALAFSVATASGPLAGGLLVEAFGWAGVFWFRIPVLLLALAGAFFVLPARGAASDAEPFDLFGALLLALTVVGVMAVMNQVGRGHLGLDVRTVGDLVPWLVLVAALAAGAGFIARSLKSAAPIIDLRLFRVRLFAAACGAHVLVNAASFMIMLLVPFYLARTLEGEAQWIGLFLAMYPLGAVLASLLARRALERFGALQLGQVSLLLAAAGLFAISYWPAQWQALAVAGALLVHGVGYGLFQVVAVDIVMGTVPRSQQGIGGSLNMLTRTLGVVTGASLGSLLFVALGGSMAADTATYLHAHAVVFATAGGVTVLAVTALTWIAKDR